MTLDKSGLKSNLENLFKDPPFEESACAKAWADAMNSYASAVGPPSTAVSTAATTLQGLLAGFAAADQAASLMESAFATFAGAVALGMATTYTGAPPTGNVGFADVFRSTSADPGARASTLADAIDTWMKTGKATLTLSPFTPWQGPPGYWT
jgi:hypothetical protein